MLTNIHFIEEQYVQLPYITPTTYHRLPINIAITIMFTYNTNNPCQQFRPRLKTQHNFLQMHYHLLITFNFFSLHQPLILSFELVLLTTLVKSIITAPYEVVASNFFTFILFIKKKSSKTNTQYLISNNNRTNTISFVKFTSILSFFCSSQDMFLSTMANHYYVKTLPSFITTITDATILLSALITCGREMGMTHRHTSTTYTTTLKNKMKKDDEGWKSMRALMKSRDQGKIR